MSKLGRFHMIDAGHSMVRDAQGGASKTRICSFSGQEYSAERIGDELVIFCTGDESGRMGVSVVGSGMDSGPAGLRALNRRNSRLRGEPA
jgi:hypothetical protein